MMSNLRRFCGATSLISNFALLHFSARGPAGILASSVIWRLLLDEPGHDRDRERQVSDDDDGREYHREPSPPVIEPRVRPTQGLEQAPGAVVDMQPRRLEPVPI